RRRRPRKSRLWSSFYFTLLPPWRSFLPSYWYRYAIPRGHSSFYLSCFSQWQACTFLHWPTLLRLHRYLCTSVACSFCCSLPLCFPTRNFSPTCSRRLNALCPCPIGNRCRSRWHSLPCWCTVL